MLVRVSALLLLAVSAYAQGYVPRFSGEVSRGQEFRKEIGSGLEFVLRPMDTGWTIGIVPKTRCVDGEDWASVVNAPYRNYNALHLDASYGVSAKEAVGINPREFLYVTNCEDYRQEAHRLEIVLWPYNHSQQEADEALAKLGTSALGKARLTISSAKVSPADRAIEGKNYGRIDWLKFRLDVASPPPERRHRP
jgi:hypothetical protein